MSLRCSYSLGLLIAVHVLPRSRENTAVSDLKPGLFMCNDTKLPGPGRVH